MDTSHDKVALAADEHESWRTWRNRASVVTSDTGC
jgi:hypothetical protein